MPLSDKVEAINNIAVPTSKNQLQSFIGLINYYIDIGKYRSSIVSPLSSLWKTKFNLDAYLGPYINTAVRNNGTVRARKEKVTDNFNIRNLTPNKIKSMPIMEPYDIHSCSNS